MIGPSSATAGDIADGQCRAVPAKRRLFDDLDDIESFCEEVCQSAGCKRYLPELETTPAAVELVASNEIIANTPLFSPMSAQEAIEEPSSSVARLEVLLVDGTNCTWTTVSELEQQQQQQQQQQNLNLATSSSSSLSSSSSSISAGAIERHRERAIQEAYVVEETDYQPAVSVNYWMEPVAAPAVSIATAVTAVQQNKSTACHNPQQQQQQQFEDQENGNLSWLLDFKLDSFIGAADRYTAAPLTTKDNYCGGNKSKPNGRPTNYAGDVRRGHVNHVENTSSAYRQDASQTAYHSANGIDSRSLSAPRPNGPKKPPFTYTELIEHALQERGELTVSAIYQWISERFPYYKSNDDRWKNSVRHNLSINPHFRKGSKAPHGAGHLWAIANRNEYRPRPLLNGLTTAVASTGQVTQNDGNESQSDENIISEIITMDEVEAATASIVQQNSEEEADSVLNPVTLEHSAEQILNGIKREVEVQYLVPMMVASNDHEVNQQDQQTTQTELQCSFKESDFLNPVSKEVVAEECGLISEGYLVTDLNPSALGLNVVDPEIIGSENLFGEELSFQFYELTSPSQLQSA